MIITETAEAFDPDRQLDALNPGRHIAQNLPAHITNPLDINRPNAQNISSYPTNYVWVTHSGRFHTKCPATGSWFSIWFNANGIHTWYNTDTGAI